MKAGNYRRNASKRHPERGITAENRGIKPLPLPALLVTRSYPFPPPS